MTITWVKRVVAWLLSTLFIWAFLLVSPLGKSAVVIDLQTTTSGLSQMFFATEESGFTEQTSRSALINPQTTELTFPFGELRGTVGNYQRWDPSDAPGEFMVSRIRIDGLIVTEEVPLTSLLPSIDMSAIEIGPSGATFRTESNDAQTLMQLDLQRFYWTNVQHAAIAAALVAFLIVLAAVLGAKRRRAARQLPELLPRTNFRGAIAVPRTALIVFTALLAVPLWLLVRGSQAIGVSWDEPTYVDSLHEFFQSGWFVPRYFFTDGTTTLADSIVHGPVGPLFGHAIAVISGNELPFQLSALAPAYDSRHLGMAILATLGIVCTGAAAAIALSSWRWGVIAAATTAGIPLFIGHGMFNIQDLPVAVGFAAVLLSFVLLARQSFGTPTRARALQIITLTLGLVLMVGTRPGIWILFVLTGFASLIVWFVLDARSSTPRIAGRLLGSRVIGTAAGMLAAYALLWVISPNVFAQPLRFLQESLATSQAFPWEGTTLTAGTLMPAQPPPQYLLLWFGAQLPVIITLAAIIGVTASLILLIRSFTRRTVASPVAYAAVPFLALTIGTPIGLWVTNATLYSGIRQLLFMMPAIAMLAVVGVFALITMFTERGRTPLVRTTWIVFGVGLSIPLIGQLQLFPYSFTYFNLPATAQQIDENWEIDGWWLSGRELLRSTPMADRTFCVESEARPRVECIRLGVLTPYLESPEQTPERINIRPDQYLLLDRFETTFTNDTCAPLTEVSRPLALQSVTLSRSFICDVSLAPYPPEGIATTSVPIQTDPGLAWGEHPALLWGWGIPSESGAAMIRSHAAVGFVLPNVQSVESATAWELVLGITAGSAEAGNQPVDVSVNGTVVGTITPTANGESSEARFQVPEQVVSALGDGRVVIGFSTEESLDTPPSGVDRNVGSGGLSLTSVTLAP